NQYGTVFGTQFAQAFQEAGGWAHQVHVAGKRLNDNAGDFAAFLFESIAHGVQIVVVQHQGVADKFGWHACRGGVAKGQQAGTGFDQQTVSVAVVTAFKLDDGVAAGKATGQTNGAHGGFGAGADQTHLLDGRQHFGQGFSQHDFAFGRRAVGQAVYGGFLYGLDNVRIGVAQNGRSPGTHVVRVLLAVCIPDVRALSAFDKARGAAHGTEGTDGRVDAAGD